MFEIMAALILFDNVSNLSLSINYLGRISPENTLSLY